MIFFYQFDNVQCTMPVSSRMNEFLSSLHDHSFFLHPALHSFPTHIHVFVTWFRVPSNIHKYSSSHPILNHLVTISVLVRREELTVCIHLTPRIFKEDKIEVQKQDEQFTLAWLRHVQCWFKNLNLKTFYLIIRTIFKRWVWQNDSWLLSFVNSEGLITVVSSFW